MSAFSRLTKLPVIDAHVHVFPERVHAAVMAWLDRNAWPLHRLLPAQEVVPCLLEQGLAGMALLTYAHRPGLADDLNAFLAGLVQGRGNLAGFGALHPDDKDPAGIVRWMVGELGLKGVKLHAHVLARPVDDPSLFPVYEACLETGAWLNIHAGSEPALSGYGYDVRRVSGAARVERLLGRYPRLKLIVPHLGIPETGRFLDLLERFPNLYLDTTMALSGFFHVEGLGPRADPGRASGPELGKSFFIDRQRIIAASDRIMYGSDFPGLPYPVEQEAAHILRLELGPEATANILYRTAQRALDLDLSQEP
ncbi:MAG: amidohydrolase [Desulfarculus sp.]|nr:MAG: amidohydrolase [Desulfarculus sp.]